jgi:Delta14-sterol reductase
LPYRINGHLAFWVTLLFVQVGWPTYDFEHDKWQLGAAPLSVLYEYTPELALATIVLSFALAAFLYLDSFRGGNRVLAVGGDSGHAAYDFFIGRELNPRVGSFDWKVFCELRPGMIGWVLLNASCWQQQRTVLGHVSGSMVLLNLFQGVYVWDALYQERAILTTMDVTTDGFGFMLVFGDLVWVPFTYSLQARYLVNHDPALGPAALAAILALYLAGYYVFRAANGQKDAFRRDPSDPSLSHLSFLQTKRGTKLLTSGWWGMARKINYLGDWIMGLTWCLVCGFDSLVPYYYAIYFGILLVHRSVRDDHMCQLKYGDDWNAYKKIVPYRFIPGIV